MGRFCQICGRGALTSVSRSHSNIATKRRQYLNLQKTVYQGKRVKACARCIKSQTKIKK
ncbi:MAG: 50S ribosomal protein L28 [Candidatus Kerfeldbacteria bacterium CG08_land_8_20_14_0_20_40_16]|uniref:Large ribosomal subunit protein bL28 n=1 Tax=Candidatus Kerfeldbacteria bacterium CG08_land_8_20_14_0_20_40_16 TaxID=2014244 RepID=A0A2H0YUX3_9BACT|nr:MAG: 50S ribosomal protein L28 [Candidatus Kerfeldbacteria bacterium CG08_land_8_20_14_0_20_40_16]